VHLALSHRERGKRHALVWTALGKPAEGVGEAKGRRTCPQGREEQNRNSQRQSQRDGQAHGASPNPYHEK
jgi:hypothetical protein